jgi:hypothetical protein
VFALLVRSIAFLLSLFYYCGIELNPAISFCDWSHSLGRSTDIGSHILKRFNYMTVYLKDIEKHIMGIMIMWTIY